ncbi:MAG: hypothetical protein R3E83_14950 [Burkholderiaceae bacterium]
MDVVVLEPRTGQLRAPKTSTRALRVALIAPAGPASGHLQALIRWLEASPAIELLGVAIDATRPALPVWLQGTGPISWLDRRRLSRHPVLAPHLIRQPLAVAPPARAMTVAELGATEVDIAILLCDCDDVTQYAYLCSEGVISIDPGPVDIDLAALRAIDRTQASLPFEIRLSTPDGASRSLLAGALGINRSIPQTGSAVLCRIVDMLRNLITRRLQTGTWPEHVGDPPGASAQIIRAAENPANPGTDANACASRLAFRYLGRRILGALRWHLKRRAGLDDIWRVGVARGHWTDADPADHITVNGPDEGFLADPFLLEHEGRRILFGEAMNPRTERGYIVACELPDQGPARLLGTALEEEFHLSFPYPFTYQGKLYMCPETHESGQIRVYACEEFPLRWRLHTVLMDAVSAVDTMLFERDGRWWMLTNLDPAETGDLCSELHLFHADSPLSEHWQPHPMNPLIIDPLRARNAGLIFDGARVFRVSQRQGFERYGESIGINEIVRLDPDHYQERLVRQIEPSMVADASGMHHLHSCGSLTVFDYQQPRRPKHR